MKKEITVVLDNHPYAREYNWLGGAVDIKNHNWIHINVKFLAEPQKYEPLLKAFSTNEPFKQLSWKGNQNCPTKSICSWTVRQSPVAKEEGHSLWLAFECLGGVPEQFFQYISDEFLMLVRISYCPPYSRKWLVKVFEPAIKS